MEEGQEGEEVRARRCFCGYWGRWKHRRRQENGVGLHGSGVVARVWVAGPDCLAPGGLAPGGISCILQLILLDIGMVLGCCLLL